MLRHWITSEREEVYFHADPHPANILILPHGALAVLDCGLTGHFSQRDAEETRNAFLAVYAQDEDAAIRYGLEMSRISDHDKYTDRIRVGIRSYLRKTRTEGLGFWFVGFLKVFLDNRVPLPYNLVLFGRTVAALDGLINTVFPGSSTVDLVGDELAFALRKRVIKNIADIDIIPIIYTLTEQAKQSPHKISKLITSFCENPAEFLKDFQRTYWKSVNRENV